MRIRALAAVLAAPLLVGGAPLSSVDVEIAITALRSHKGVVRACMTASPELFPRCQGDDAAYSIVLPAGEATTLTFDGVRPGTYAIALLHDENDNGRVDRALGMMPKEGFGFSRDAPVRMGPPEFDDAAFQVRASSIRQTIRMRYML